MRTKKNVWKILGTTGTYTLRMNTNMESHESYWYIYIYTYNKHMCLYKMNANMSYIHDMKIWICTIYISYRRAFWQEQTLVRANKLAKNASRAAACPYNNITYPTSGTGASFHAFLAWAMSWILLSRRKKYSANMPFLSTVKAGDRGTQKSQRRRGAGTREHHNKPCIFWCVCVPKIIFFKL